MKTRKGLKLKDKRWALMIDFPLLEHYKEKPWNTSQNGPRAPTSGRNYG
jgi:hypothetical protein